MRGTQDDDVADGFDLAVGIARRAVEVGDDGVVGIGRIECDGGTRGDLLDLTGGAEAAALQDGGGAFEDVEARDLSIGGGGEGKGNQPAQQSRITYHVVSPPRVRT